MNKFFSGFLFILILSVHYSFHAQLTSEVKSFTGDGPILFADVTFNLGDAYSNETGNKSFTVDTYKREK